MYLAIMCQPVEDGSYKASVIYIGPRPHTHLTNTNNLFTNKVFSVYFITVSVSYEEKKKKKMYFTKFNWVSGSLPMLYKLVLGPIPIIHTNFQDNPLTTLGISRHFKII